MNKKIKFIKSAFSIICVSPSKRYITHGHCWKCERSLLYVHDRCPCPPVRHSNKKLALMYMCRMPSEQYHRLTRGNPKPETTSTPAVPRSCQSSDFCLARSGASTAPQLPNVWWWTLCVSVKIWENANGLYTHCLSVPTGPVDIGRVPSNFH